MKESTGAATAEYSRELIPDENPQLALPDLSSSLNDTHDEQHKGNHQEDMKNATQGVTGNEA